MWSPRHPKQSIHSYATPVDLSTKSTTATNLALALKQEGGKVGVLVSCGAAIICGASVTLVNFFWNVGQSV